MLVDAETLRQEPDAPAALLRALHRVVTADGRAPSRSDADGLVGVWRTVLGQDGPVPTGDITDAELARALRSPVLRTLCVQLAAVLAVDVVALDPVRIRRVLAIADALAVHADFVTAVERLLDGDVRWVAADQIRHNIATIPGLPYDPAAPYAVFLPYHDGAEDPGLATRYDELEQLPSGTLGRRFWEHYRTNGFAFPGRPEAVNEVWATPHDVLHLLSGYSTSAQGEILVAAFTTGQLAVDDDPMESHVLPTILIYSLGIDINKGLNQGDRERMAADPSWAEDLTGTVHLGLDPAKLWVALDRGRAMDTDVYSGHWRFWDHVEVPLDELRDRYGVPPLDPADAASDDDAVDVSRFERPSDA